MGLQALFTVLILYILHATYEIVACPTYCECPSTARALCSGGLQFPTGISTTLSDLEISNIRLERLEKRLFEEDYYPNLLILGLKYCHIRQVDTNSFESLVSLVDLDLSNNNISYLHPETFENSEINYLDLDSNPINLTGNVYLNSKSLLRLSLRNCNITEIARFNFEGLPNLKYLYLEGNRLGFVSHNTFKNLKHLIILNLAGNNWICNETLVPLIRWYRQHFRRNYPRCAEPMGLLWSNDSFFLLSAFRVTYPETITPRNAKITGKGNEFTSTIISTLPKTENLTTVYITKPSLDPTNHSNSIYHISGFRMMHAYIIIVIFSAVVMFLTIGFTVRNCQDRKKFSPKVVASILEEPLEMLKTEIYFESTSTVDSEGYLVPRYIDTQLEPEDHIYEEIE